MEDDLQKKWKTTSTIKNGRRPQFFGNLELQPKTKMEDNLKKIKIKTT
jgi:hypothetical protein